ncbi:MAG: hypothetical protein J0L59_01365 [Xanthomonadales bacterium]|nr:hypothetical protein [Xanthomonadales bacterium]
MRERPILFSGAMVRAILEGHKTQTRRVVKNPPAAQFCGLKSSLGYPASEGSTWAGFGNPSDPMYVRCPYGQPGDRLWVRETWGYRGGSWSTEAPEVQSVNIHYQADDSRISYTRAADDDSGLPRCREPRPDEDYVEDYYNDFLNRYWKQWRPSIHMPRWACRLELEITDVRVERLQAISEADAVAEGASTPGPFARHHFMDLWASINGQASWDANPWVWALTFKRIKS